MITPISPKIVGRWKQYESLFIKNKMDSTIKENITGTTSVITCKHGRRAVCQLDVRFYKDMSSMDPFLC